MYKISTRTHGVLDYLTAGFALAFPRVLGCSSRFTSAVTMLALGKIGYAMLTRHELGIVRKIPMKAHLVLDCIGGATLCALPFLLEEEDSNATACAVGMGVFDIVAAPLSCTTPSFDQPRQVRLSDERAAIPTPSPSVPPVMANRASAW